MTHLDTGWLSPTGEMMKCDSYEHLTVARSICAKCDYKTNDTPDQAIMSHGWVHITRGSLLDHDYHVYYDTSLFLTPEQVKYLKPYFEDNDCPIDELEKEIFFERLELM